MNRASLEKLPSDFNEFANIPLDQPIPDVEDTKYFQDAWVKFGYDQVRFGRVQHTKDLLSKKIDCIRMLNKCETDTLVDRWVEHGDYSAVTRLVQHNMRLVFTAMSTYGLNVKEREDNFANGLMGLEEGIRRYNPNNKNEKGDRIALSTYVMYWIRQSMTRNSIVGEQLIRIPVHLNGLLNEVKRAMMDLSETMDEPMTDPVRITEYINENFRADKPQNKKAKVGKVSELIPYATGVASADFMSRDSGDSELSYLDMVQGSTASEVDDALKNEEIKALATELMGKVKMTDRERTILSMRFGIGAGNSGDEMKIAAIAEFVGLTKAGVRKNLANVLERMRSYSESKGLNYDGE